MDVNKNVQNTQIAYNMRQFLKFLRILNIFTQKLVTAKVNQNDSAALSHRKLGRPSRKSHPVLPGYLHVIIRKYYALVF